MTFVRGATLADLVPLAELFEGYRRFYEGAADLDGAQRFLRARLEGGDSVVFVAERDGRLVGFTQLYASFSSLSMHRIWILNDLFVAPTHRRAGVGGALVARAELFARGAGAKRLALATQTTNAPAQALCQARGWKRDQTFDHFILEL
jgi:GNAT superfamily N-acetyltransferase